MGVHCDGPGGCQNVSLQGRTLVCVTPELLRPRSTTVKDRLAGIAVSAGSGLGTALAGAPWWAVLVVVLAFLGSDRGLVILLARPGKSRRLTTLLTSWEAPSEPEE